MSYVLGVDLGTTRTAAAVHRDGLTSVVTLGVHSATVPSAVFVADDGPVLVGEPALRRGLADPTRLAREFKRRIGDSEPLLLGGAPWSPVALTSRLLGEVVELVAEREGGPPERVVLTHPANWKPFKTDLLLGAAASCGLEQVELRSEPEAAALHYASQARVPSGALVAVYDLGGGTFDAAVLRKDVAGFTTVGRPDGLERFGGVDVDAAVLGHVRQVLGDSLDALDPGDPASLTAMARLRHECVAAKEALSADVDVAIPVVLPHLVTEVRLTRAELEAMVAPVLGDTVRALQRALRSANVDAADLAAVLLAGGASRMPLVARLVTAELGRPVAVDAHPKHAIALGAAWTAAAPTGAPALDDARPPDAASTPPQAPDAPAAAELAVEPAAVSRGGRRWLAAAGALAAGLVVAVVLGTTDLVKAGAGDIRQARAEPGGADTAGAGGGAPVVVIEDVERDAVTGIRVRFSIAGSAPPGAPLPLHADFFYDDQHPESIGIDTYARYARYGGMYYVAHPPVFVMPEVDGLGTRITQLCALVADADDRVADASSPTCIPVPSR